MFVCVLLRTQPAKKTVLAGEIYQLRVGMTWRLLLLEILGKRASYGIRTHDLPLTERVLCQLS